MIFNRFKRVLRNAAGENGSDDGGSADRGDDFTPTDDDATETEVKAAAKEPVKDPEPKKEPVKEPVKAAGADAGGEEEGEEGEEGEEKPEGKRKDARMPISRHKAILEKERAAREEAERQLAQYQKGQQVAATNEVIDRLEKEILDLDEQYAKLITDGDHKEAAAVMKQIRAKERDVNDKKLELTSTITSARAVEKARYDIVVERLEEAYPVLNQDDEAYDAEVAQDVVDLAATYRGRGLTPAEAIQKAAKKLLGVATKKQEAAAEITPRVTKEQEEDARRQAEKERKAAQVKKNLEASGKQPADLNKVGADNDKAGGSITAKDVMKMSHDDFVKLDEETLSRMRGDVLA